MKRELRQEGDAGMRAIYRHFGQCSGKPAIWDARRLAIVLWVNELTRRHGGNLVKTDWCIGRNTPPDMVPLIERAAAEALQVAQEAVAALANPKTARPRRRPKPRAKEDPARRVYFIQGEHGGAIKIGTSRDVEMRLAVHQIGCPVLLRILGTQQGGRALEAVLHRRFAVHRLHNEWFEPCAELLAYIAGLEP